MAKAPKVRKALHRSEGRSAALVLRMSAAQREAVHKAAAKRGTTANDLVLAALAPVIAGKA